MVLGSLNKAQQIRSRKKLVKSLQFHAKHLMYDRMMFKVNDQLAVMLANSATGNKAEETKVKIEAINKELQKVRRYQMNIHRNKPFQISTVLTSVSDTIEDYFKRDIKIERLFDEILAPIGGNQSLVEGVIFESILILMDREDVNMRDVRITLGQKDQDAVIILQMPGRQLSEDEATYIEDLSEEFTGKVIVRRAEEGSLIEIKLPILFHLAEKQISQEVKVTLEKTIQESMKALR